MLILFVSLAVARIVQIPQIFLYFILDNTSTFEVHWCSYQRSLLYFVIEATFNFKLMNSWDIRFKSTLTN